LRTHRLEADLIDLIEFPSKDANKAFASASVDAARRRSGRRLRLFDDSELAGTISYLTKALAALRTSADISGLSCSSLSCWHH
jgi:hypothetical protein